MAKLKLVGVRLAFTQLFEAKQINGEGEPKFGVCSIIDPADKKLVAEIKAAIKAAADEKWGAKAGTILAELYKKDKVCFKENEKTKDGTVYDGFEGTFHLNASSKARPSVFDRDKTPLVAADGKPYAGCYGNVLVDIWAQDNTYGKRVNATLRGVQFSRDGDAFSGGVPASEDDFDDLSDTGADDDLA